MKRRATRISTAYRDVVWHSHAFDKLSHTLGLDGFSLHHCSLWRCEDGTYIARAEWRSKKDRFRWTVAGIQFATVQSEANLAKVA